MKGVNSCTFLGALGKDPERRATPSGTAVTSFSIAINEKRKQNGETVEHTEWVNIVSFGRLAEIAGDYLRKGSKVYVEGKMRTEKYQDRETGQTRYSTKIVADELVMLDSKPEQQQAPAGGFDSFDEEIPV